VQYHEAGMALAAMIFGKWHPIGTLLACLPYVLPVVLLAGFIGRAYAPKALGLPYIKER
jgi:ABC-type uncharacterized transport system permease subunit